MSAPRALAPEKEFFAGCVAGFSKIYAGQPFDIVKVRLQSMQDQVKPSVFTIVRNIIRHEGGVRALWKGSLPPLLGVGGTASIQFGVNENVKKLILKANGGQPFTIGQLFLSGSIAGIANCSISIPAEHFRIRMQTQSQTAKVYNGSIDCMKKIFRTYGLKGVFRGTVPTLCRDSIGYGVYFALYTTLLRKLAPEKTRLEYKMWQIGLSGAIAGISLWTAVFPFDVVKTRIQTDSLDKPQYKGMLDCFAKLYRAKGWKAFVQGYPPCFARAIPVNGIVFMLYETLYRAMLPTQLALMRH